MIVQQEEPIVLSKEGGLDLERYQMPRAKDPSSLRDWQEAVRNGKAQLEHQHNR